MTYLARKWPRSWSCHAGLGVACSRYRSREQLILNDLILEIATLQHNAFFVCVWCFYDLFMIHLRFYFISMHVCVSWPTYVWFGFSLCFWFHGQVLAPFSSLNSRDVSSVFWLFSRFHYFLCRVESHGTISVYMHGYVVDLLRWGRAAFALDRRAEVNNLRTTEKLLLSYSQRMSWTSVIKLSQFFAICPIDCWFKQFHTSDSLKRVCFEADAARILANASTTFATFPIKCSWQRHTWQRQT